MSTADILRNAANLIDSGQTDSPVDAILQAAPPGEAVTALRHLAAHLNYGADRNPRNVLTRWASMRSRDVIVREIRAAAHPDDPGHMVVIWQDGRGRGGSHADRLLVGMELTLISGGCTGGGR
ncbi:hypothetical protein [Nonomuraea sp. SBT364]|uniref:hypothetical protein n=1 Tax=Nonomuraea sp. SBT364 TaxID=1580530 RepID=UPI00066EA3B8|nr:hypothetical protein [Nonomuraea sp. SBT364]